MRVGSEEYTIWTYTTLAVVSAIAVLSCYRAVTIGVTHDEVATMIHYYRYSPWEIMMYPDPWPNNHIVNTILSKWSMAIWGRTALPARLPNLLALILYLWGAWRIVREYTAQHKLIGFLGMLTFLSYGLLVEFFALSRGYGISCSLTVLSLSFLISGWSSGRSKDIALGLGLAILASYANFTALVYWAAAVSVVGIYYITRRTSLLDRLRPIGLLAIASIAYLALIYTPIRKMRGTDQFKYWSDEGNFVSETLHTSMQWWLSSIHKEILGYAVWGVIAITAIATVFLIYRLIVHRRVFNNGLTASTVVLLTVVAVVHAQHFALGTPHLSGRTALFIWPLFSAIVLGLLTEIQELWLDQNWKRYLVLLPLCGLLLYHISTTSRTDSTTLWWYDQYNRDVLDLIAEQGQGDSTTLHMHWMYHKSITYYKEINELNWLHLHPQSWEIDSMSTADYYYVMYDDKKILDSHFDLVKSFGGAFHLMQRKTAIDIKD